MRLLSAFLTYCFIIVGPILLNAGFAQEQEALESEKAKAQNETTERNQTDSSQGTEEETSASSVSLDPFYTPPIEPFLFKVYESIMDKDRIEVQNLFVPRAFITDVYPEEMQTEILAKYDDYLDGIGADVISRHLDLTEKGYDKDADVLFGYYKVVEWFNGNDLQFVHQIQIKLAGEESPLTPLIKSAVLYNQTWYIVDMAEE